MSWRKGFVLFYLILNLLSGYAAAYSNSSAPLVGLYRFEQTDFTAQLDDTSGRHNHGNNLGGSSIAEGKYCRGFDSNGSNSGLQTANAFSSRLDLDDDVGIQGTISFWFNSNTPWNEGGYSGSGERTLFDASTTASNKYFNLEILNDGRLQFSFEDSNDGDFGIIEPSGPVRAANTWYYITVTWDLENNNYQIYLDGDLRISQDQNSNGQLVHLGPIIFGDNSSTYGRNDHHDLPSFTSANGRFDEVRIYDEVKSQVEIQTDMNDDNDCIADFLIAHYQMDKLSLDGTVGEVIDQTTNFNAQAKNDANTENLTPAIAGNPGTCGYGTFDGHNQYMALPNSFENLQGSFTITAWINASNLEQGSRIFADDENNTQGYAFSLGDPGSGKLRFYSRGVNPISVDTSASVISKNTWTFVTAVHNSQTKTREIYVNGVAQIVTGGGLSNTYTGSWGVDTGIASIGGETDSGETNNRFTGAIDEVKVYDGALSAAQINVIYNETHPCDSYIDHFELDTLDAQGITCDADNIVIKACADASCTTINPDAVDVALSINNTFYKTVTVAGANGTATSYAHTTTGNAALSLDQTYECTDSPSSIPCNVTFSDSAFVFSAIPTQISGKPSVQGFNASTLTLQAVETDNNTGACIGAFPDGGDIPVNLSYSCDDGTCTQQLALTNNSNTHNLTQTAAAYSLRFSTDSTAIFDINYPDAARLILNAQKTIEVEDSDGNKVIKNLTGSSNAFVERPFGFFIDVLNNPKAVAADGGAFKKAGEDFTVELSAVVWQAGQDQNDNGIPDDGIDLSNNAVTVNFGNETTPETAEISAGKVAPESGVLGDLTSTRFNFTNGIATDNAVSYDEVGIISFTANLTGADYLGADDILGEVTNVGRFTPAYFTQTVDEFDHGSLNAYHYGTCSPITNSWAYAGQTRDRGDINVGAISYEPFFEPAITITAFNMAGAITQNYTETGFMKLDAAGITIPVPIEDDVAARLFPEVVNEKVKMSSTMIAGDVTIPSGTKGIVRYTFNALDHFTYEHNKHSKLNAFEANIPFTVTDIEDEDQIKLYSGDNTNITATEKIITSGVEIRFGRWLLENSYGPETSDLPVTMFTQYFDGSKFINNEKENCLIPAVGSEVSTGNIGDGGMALWGYRLADVVAPDTDPRFVDVNKSFVSGLYQWLLFSPPGAGKTGSLAVEYQVPPWLQYDWNNDDTFDNNPTATLTFGLYRGNDRIIYQREIAK